MLGGKMRKIVFSGLLINEWKTPNSDTVFAKRDMLSKTMTVTPLLTVLVDEHGEIFTIFKDAIALTSLRNYKRMCQRSCEDLTVLGIEPCFYAADSAPVNFINNDINFNRLTHLTRLYCRKHTELKMLISVIKDDVSIEFATLNAPTTFSATLLPLQQHQIAFIANTFKAFNLVTIGEKGFQ